MISYNANVHIFLCRNLVSCSGWALFVYIFCHHPCNLSALQNTEGKTDRFYKFKSSEQPIISNLGDYLHKLILSARPNHSRPRIYISALVVTLQILQCSSKII